ncbi:hypothetical protein JKP88DRAFT_237616 [Tribonema minus]|uniref:Mitochondrial import inner membrane translocase subunit n=1 Tax=Tribonema minus TaxID=303371 RepID=A0A835Z2N5_9STRA|nr:hypothetical protein JKP88DRAFT_237616 [Tribonema minus]
MTSLGELSVREQAELMKHVDELQAKDGVKTFHNVVYRCYDHCVASLRSSKLDAKEVACLQRCQNKYMRLHQRAGLRFQEYQQQRNAPTPT